MEGFGFMPCVNLTKYEHAKWIVIGKTRPISWRARISMTRLIYVGDKTKPDEPWTRVQVQTSVWSVNSGNTAGPGMHQERYKLGHKSCMNYYCVTRFITMPIKKKKKGERERWIKRIWLSKSNDMVYRSEWQRCLHNSSPRLYREWTQHRQLHHIVWRNNEQYLLSNNNVHFHSLWAITQISF